MQWKPFTEMMVFEHFIFSVSVESDAVMNTNNLAFYRTKAQINTNKSSPAELKVHLW